MTQRRGQPRAVSEAGRATTRRGSRCWRRCWRRWTTIKQTAAAEPAGAEPRAGDPKNRLTQPWSLWDVMKPDPIPERQDRHQQQRRLLDRLHRRQLRLRRRRLRHPRAHLAGPRRLRAGLPLLPAARPAGAGGAARRRWRRGGSARTSSSTPATGRTSCTCARRGAWSASSSMSQKDIQTDLTKPDVIGMGSYNSDSHNIQRIVNADGFAENEGDMQVSVTPYQIPYRVMLPKRDRGHQPAGAGRLLGVARRLLDAAHGAAVHDHRPRRRRRGQDGHRRATSRCRTSRRRRCRRSCRASAPCSSGSSRSSTSVSVPAIAASAAQHGPPSRDRSSRPLSLPGAPVICSADHVQ